jgi:hypothetical protein
VIEGLSLLVLSLALAAGVGEEAVSDEVVLDRAEQAFREGLALRESPEQARAAFRRAAAAYEQLRRRGASNVALYRNLATASSLAGDLPRTVFACRRGLRLAPSDRYLREQLEAARAQVAAANVTAVRPPSDEWPAWLNWVSPRERLGLAVTGWTLACLAFTRWRMTRRSAWVHLGWLSLLAALFLAVTLVLDVWRHREEQEHPIVVLAQDGVTLRTGNARAYPSRDRLPPLNGGVEARMLFMRGDWLQIELAGGDVGWVPRDQVLLDVP